MAFSTAPHSGQINMHKFKQGLEQMNYTLIRTVDYSWDICRTLFLSHIILVSVCLPWPFKKDNMSTMTNKYYYSTFQQSSFVKIFIETIVFV